MSYLSESFDSLEIQVKEIIKIKQNLQQENKELGLENENLQKALEKCQSEIEEL